LAKNYDLLLSILPFEKEYFSKTSLRVEYVGHPLVQEINPSESQQTDLIAIFPGSRMKELYLNFPLQLRVAKRFPGYKIAVSLAQPHFLPILEEIAEDEGVHIEFSSSQDLKKRATFAIAKSGTITLELALHAIPTVVTYGVSPFDLFVAKYLLGIRLPYYCLVNILAQKEIFPELIGPAFTEESLYAASKKIIDSLKEKKQACLEVRSILGNQDASRRASELILSLIS
jgi:lipid-A-disaccharide synthase